MKRGVVFAVVFLVMAFGGLALRGSHAVPKIAAAHESSGPPAPPPSYETTKTELAKQKKLAEVLADAAPGSWSRRAKAAGIELSYAQLTGDYDTYAQADDSLKKAFAAARVSIDDESLGPNLLKAQMDYELHRNGAALDALRFVDDPALDPEVTSLRGAIRFQLGDYEEGIALLRQSVAMDPSPGHAQRLAIALAKVGGEDEARAIFDETEKKASSPRGLAWLAWQRGKIALERGRRDEARRQMGRALVYFPGFWQVEEQLAELDAEEGRTDAAIASYRALVAKTGDPEFMDALAELVPAEREALEARSNAIYADRLVKLPEASYGHALEHFLKMVPDAARAVEIAEKNVALRPNGEARTRLAQAYLRVGRLEDARAAILGATESAWVSAESYATAVVILRALGDDGADAMQKRALARNPHAMDEIAWLTTRS
ncbi:MAG TPA: tetratricopeptide repeat protein [Labilithrix sp.]